MKENTKDKLLIRWGPPFALLVLLTLSFGLLLPWLGYGFDEWQFIYYSTRGAQGLTELFHYDGHPQAVWSFIQSFKILGYTPLYWHLYSFLWRWLAVLSFWLCLERIWPTNRRQNFFAAALFAIHPIFTLQICPNEFYEVWAGYVMLFLSFLFTILAIQNQRRQGLYTIIAMLLTIGHVFTREYGWFVELMRPVVIWLVLPSQAVPRKKLLQAFKVWLPFFLIFASALIWRGFFYVPSRETFQVQGDLLANPGRMLLTWITDWISDSSIVLVTSWYKTFNSEYVYLTRPLNIALLLLMILIAVFFYLYVRKLDHSSQGGKTWAPDAILLGLPSVLFGILPFYIASYSLHLTDPPFNSRMVIGMLPGAALITVAILEMIISEQGLRNWIMVLILSLSVGWHIRYTNDFRKIWAYQSSFLQQLTWRVPAMERNTALFVWQPFLPEIDDKGLSILYGDFALSMAVSSIYDPNPNPTESKLPYWYYPFFSDQVEVMPDATLHSDHATAFFDGNTSDSLFFYYDPEGDRCLLLITEEARSYSQYPDVVRQFASQATTDRMISTLNQNVKLRDEILRGNEHSWCFYFQKAEVARQYRQWDEIPLLWQGVMKDKVRTKFGTEYIPFIDGFAHLAEWQKAMELTMEAKRISKGMNSILCPLWDEIERSTTPSDQRDETIRQVRSTLECASP